MGCSMRKSSALRWLNENAGKYKIHIVVLMVLQITLGIITVSFALILKELIDFAVAVDVAGVRHSFVLLVAVILAQLLLGIVGRYMTEATSSSLENAFKQRVFGGLLYKDYAQLQAVHSGEWMNRLTSDTVVCAGGIVGILPSAAGMLVRMIGAGVALLLLQPEFVYVMVPAGVVMLLVTYAFRKVMKRLHKRVQESDGRLRSFLQEHLGSMQVVRAFAVEQQTLEQATERMEAHKAARMTKNHFSNVCNAGFSGAMNGMYLLAIGYCGYGIMLGNIAYGTFTAVLQLIGQIQVPFAGITGILPRFYAMIASAERLMEAEKTLAEESVSDKAGKSTKAERPSAREAGEQCLPKEKIDAYYAVEFEAICFEDAMFSYHKDSGEAVLQHFNMEIQKKQCVALTGQSGCGKSTLFKLMMDLYSLDAGRRYLRSKDGSVQELNKSWRRLFAYVPQENYLMSGTVREIVAFGDKSRMSDEEGIRRALRIACAEKFVYALEQGIETVLGERGQGFSEGQMQRIAIARAIFADCPILLLDEATSALDGETEKQLLQNLKALTDKTVIIITHRPEALKLCESRLEFGDGRAASGGGVS